MSFLRCLDGFWDNVDGGEALRLPFCEASDPDELLAYFPALDKLGQRFPIRFKGMLMIFSKLETLSWW